MVWCRLWLSFVTDKDSKVGKTTFGILAQSDKAPQSVENPNFIHDIKLFVYNPTIVAYNRIKLDCCTADDF